MHDKKQLIQSKLITFQILCMNEQYWYKAELNGKVGIVPSTSVEMRDYDWFFGPINREKAEEILLERKADGTYSQPDGAFLVRHDESSEGKFSVLVKLGESVQQFKVLSDNTGRYSIWGKKFNSLNQVLEHHRTTSASTTRAVLLKDMF
ncbi:growth factor receptor-bound protein 2-like [Lingula anatina]|uniref:Growth factor receptor-bound protein 2-like n=1 Tax=Lingula anatina TaxID=7574 RepID=A0A1S3JD35_LINAN|nr:growth factor receptor-bound protein 2-like [Lingula anatina]|eukprot:XP_013408238.1 growth factor receptor-bound protein 2-like [Lingula anatina]